MDDDTEFIYPFWKDIYNSYSKAQISLRNTYNGEKFVYIPISRNEWEALVFIETSDNVAPQFKAMAGRFYEQVWNKNKSKNSLTEGAPFDGFVFQSPFMFAVPEFNNKLTPIKYGHVNHSNNRPYEIKKVNYKTGKSYFKAENVSAMMIHDGLFIQAFVLIDKEDCIVYKVIPAREAFS